MSSKCRNREVDILSFDMLADRVRKCALNELRVLGTAQGTESRVALIAGLGLLGLFNNYIVLENVSCVDLERI